MNRRRPSSSLSKSPKSSNFPAPAARIEPLAARRLFSAALSGTQLYVTGTDAGDHVLIAGDASDASVLRVNVNGAWSTFDRTAVAGIQVDVGSGRDHVVVASGAAGGISVPMTVLGGGGNDLIIGGSADDVLFGGGGRDRVDGGAGNDRIVGGSARDLIAGGDGNDTLVGGNGDDALDGGNGDDVLTGGAGDDFADGNAGDDALNGNGGFDHLVGGAGDDALGGGRGDDQLDGGAGSDALSGGAGQDDFASEDATAPGAVLDLVADQTAGEDRLYVPVDLSYVPETYRQAFVDTFPDSEPVGVRVNDDHTFTMLYRYNGDGAVYHARFTFTGSHPFEESETVELDSYEVAPGNLPSATVAAFLSEHPGAVVKAVVADHGDEGKFALIRYSIGTGESQWAKVEWPQAA
ncbi:MAG TPA: calcium-binding protein [Tepidisphaeraceae bacterium]|nr:calcium-binding protein [Tepidisphaeraceae bacterium]